MLLAAVIGGYTLIGGLGATFYVSYFNTALIFVLIIMLVVEVFYNPYDNPDNPFGNATRLYEFISCWKAPNGNRDESYLTFFSPGKYYCFDLILKIHYSTRAIIGCGLYTFYPIYEDHFFVFKEFFQKILSLCMVSIQERFVIKSRL